MGLEPHLRIGHRRRAILALSFFWVNFSALISFNSLVLPATISFPETLMAFPHPMYPTKYQTDFPHLYFLQQVSKLCNDGQRGFRGSAFGTPKCFSTFHFGLSLQKIKNYAFMNFAHALKVQLELSRPKLIIVIGSHFSSSLSPLVTTNLTGFSPILIPNWPLDFQ